MAVLDDAKTLLNISDTSKDSILSIYIRRAERAIVSYMCISDQTIITNIDTTYPDAICEYVIEAYNRQGTEGLKQFMQGSRQAQIETGLSDMVKALLPPPYVTMINTGWPYPDEGNGDSLYV